MFEGIADRPRAYRSAGLVTEIATERWQVTAYHALRRAVFVAEQGMFRSSDEDAEDEIALPIVSMTTSHGMLDEVVGTVRIFGKPSAPPGTWYGGRLAVAPDYRRHGLIGESLIRAAVCSAHALGCRRFLATVQRNVVRYFERHHFTVCGEVNVCGVAHAWMEADLGHYPPRYFGRVPASFLVPLSQTTEAA
jgi:putative N-acetyltransferase (TIGR04045 family)